VAALARPGAHLARCRRLASGWENEIGDELLRQDLLLATDGQPERRLATAGELADRLRRLGQRHADMAEQRRAQDAARRDHEALARAQVRRPITYALIGVLVLGIAVALWLRQEAVNARNLARAELDRANALARFLNEDLIGRSNPLVSAKGPDATLREVLLAARDRVPARFEAQPETAAVIHGSLATLFSAIDLFQDAEAQARQALTLIERDGRSDGDAAFQARTVLARVLSRMGRFDEAAQQLEQLERLSAHTTDPLARQRLAAARSTWFIGRGEFDKAVVQLRAAIAGLGPTDPGNTAARDTLRLDLITTLTLAGQDQQALDEGGRLIDEAQGRKEDSALLVALARLAQVRAYRNDHAAAEKLLLEAQPVIVARLGENHSRHLQLLGELLGVAFRSGDWPRATGYAQMAHERVRAEFGDGHVLTYVTLLNWARTLDEAGRAKDAVDKARTAHRHLLNLVGPASPQTQDAAFVLALIELELGGARNAQSLIDQLDPAALESGRATGQWPASIDALRGMALQLKGDAAAARPLLDSALAALKDEEALAKPARLYVAARQARARLH
jgi:eukaryotic-like serine/threonine-protein kinase